MITKKLRAFHILIIVSLVVGFILNNIGEESEIGVMNNVFLTLITFSYLFASLFGLFKN
jgi:hypothetical protein